jgi:hypothetical protein
MVHGVMEYWSVGLRLTDPNPNIPFLHHSKIMQAEPMIFDLALRTRIHTPD